MNRIKTLQWDTDFFGYRVGRLDASSLTDIKNASLESYKLVYVFSEFYFSEYEKNLVDRKLTYNCEISNIQDVNSQESNIVITQYNPELHSYEELLNLVLESGVYSRFLIDPNFINDEYRRLYTCWINNSLRQGSNHIVIVACDGNEIVGFATLSEKEQGLADIGLLAVATHVRGKKIGARLIQAAKKKAKKLGCNHIQVVTQKDNIPAVGLYQASGFKLNELMYIYHIWNNDTI